MNRLHHLKQTLPQNLLDNEDYPQLEFILLDYNSKDGMEAWVKQEMASFIASGRLTYFRTEAPAFFNRSHSRNLAFNLCSGALLCNVDADNFTGKGFAAYLNAEFCSDPGILVNSHFLHEYLPYKDAFGRFGAWRNDFHEAGGYDEAMASYGYEDIDFYERLVLLGRKEVKIDNFSFLRSIAHDDAERISQEFFHNNLEKLYLAYGNGFTKTLFLFKDKTFETGTLTAQDEYYEGLFTIQGGAWQKGAWEITPEELRLRFRNGKEMVLGTTNQGLVYLLKDESTRLSFFHISNEVVIEEVKQKYSLVTNVSRMKKNMEAQKARVNPEGYGRGMVYRNFTREKTEVKEPLKGVSVPDMNRNL